MNTDLESEALLLDRGRVRCRTELQQVVCKSDGFRAEWCNVREYLLIVKKKEAVGFSNIEEQSESEPRVWTAAGSGTDEVYTRTIKNCKPRMGTVGWGGIHHCSPWIQSIKFICGDRSGVQGFGMFMGIKNQGPIKLLHCSFKVVIVVVVVVDDYKWLIFMPLWLVNEVAGATMFFSSFTAGNAGAAEPLGSLTPAWSVSPLPSVFFYYFIIIIYTWDVKIVNFSGTLRGPRYLSLENSHFFKKEKKKTLHRMLI